MKNALFEIEDNFDRNRYTNVLPKIQYVPVEREAPSVFSLYNLEKYTKLVKEINESDIPDEIKKFLKHSASRHIVFDYAKIAEFYCHSDKKVQELMEKSGLVIIDFDDALENGFVKLQKNLEEIYENSKDE